MKQKTVSDKAIKKLLVDLKLFVNMTSAQKAAFRARVSRYLGVIGDEANAQYDSDIADILTAVQSKVGKAAKKKSSALTVDDIVSEYNEGLDYGDTRKLAAFRAKSARLINKLTDQYDIDTVNDILSKIENEVSDINRQRIINMAIKAGLVDDTEEGGEPKE